MKMETLEVTLALIGLRAPALLVATLTALHPALVVAPAALSGGVIATALLMLGLWALSDRDDSEPLIATAGGLSLGLSSLFNPLLLWSAPLVAVWLILSGRRLQSVVITAAVILGAAGPPALWMYRNASVGLGPTLTRAPDLERYMGVLSELESPALPSSTREAAILEELKAPPLAPDAANTSLFAQMDGEARWRLREQGNAYLQLGNNRALRTLVAHSADTAFTRLKIAYTPDGNTAAWLGETAGPATPNTPGTSTLASGWLMLNFLLLAATIAGAVALLWRRHLHEAGLLLGLGVVIVLGSITLPGESERLPVFILQMVLIGGVLSPQPVRVAREQRGARRSGGLNLQRLGGAAPGVSLAPLTPLGSAQAPPKPAGTGQNDIHPILRSHTPELNDNPPSPGRLV